MSSVLDATPQIVQQMTATGVADVIVILGSAANWPTAANALGIGSSTAQISEELRPYFIQSPRTQRGALATSADVALGDVGTVVANLMRVYENLGVILGTVEPSGLIALQNDPRVKKVVGTPQFSLIRPVRRGGASLRRRWTWGIERLNVAPLWSQGLTGKGVRVGHLDTGVDGRHPALKKALAMFAIVDDRGIASVSSDTPHDSGDHGTHTAGTIAGRPVKGRHIGVAPGADLVSAAVIEGGDVVARILGGLDWVLEQKVRMISMSLGLRGWVEDFLPIFDQIRALGVLPVVAAGNEGVGTSRSPGNYPHVLSVGAFDGTGVPSFSSSQEFKDDRITPDIVAPGVDVISAAPGGGYQSMDGTSMAVPHIAGLAALLMQAKPGASAGEIEEALRQSCVLPAAVPAGRANRGVPDGVAALSRLGLAIGVGAAFRPKAATKKNVEQTSSRRSRASKRQSTGRRGRKKT